MVQRYFGGKVQTSYKCSTCQQISVHKESFTELHLAIPDQPRLSAKEQRKELSKDGSSSLLLRMDTLVNNYLEVERLEGENQYHCDRCNGLQDAIKSVKILEGPQVT